MCEECTSSPLYVKDAASGQITSHTCVYCRDTFKIERYCDVDKKSPARCLFTHGKWFGPYCGGSCLKKDWLKRAVWNLEHPPEAV